MIAFAEAAQSRWDLRASFEPRRRDGVVLCGHRLANKVALR